MTSTNANKGKSWGDRLAWGLLFVGILLFIYTFVRFPSTRSTLLVGNPAPPIEFLYGNEKKTLEDFRGKAVMITFWANWCGVCREELPKLAELEDQIKSSNFVLLGLNVDGETPDSELKKYPSRMIHKFNRESLDGYKIEGIPATVLIDGEGIIRRVFVGPYNWLDDRILGQIRRFVQS